MIFVACSKLGVDQEAKVELSSSTLPTASSVVLLGNDLVGSEEAKKRPVSKVASPAEVIDIASATTSASSSVAASVSGEKKKKKKKKKKTKAKAKTKTKTKYASSVIEEPTAT